MPLTGTGVTVAKNSLAISKKRVVSLNPSLSSTSSPSPQHHGPSALSSDEAAGLPEGDGKISEARGYSTYVPDRKKELHRKFLSIVHKVRDYIDQTDKIEDVILGLCTLPIHLKHQKKYEFLESERMRIGKMTTADDLVLYLTPHWSAFNTDILSYLVDCLHNEILVKECVAYEADLKSFLQDTTLGQVDREQLESAYSSGQTMEIELLNERPLSYIHDFGRELRDALACSHPIRTVKITLNSVHIELSLLCSLDLAVFSSKEIQDFLYSKDVMSIAIDGSCVFEVSCLLINGGASIFLFCFNRTSHCCLSMLHRAPVNGRSQWNGGRYVQ
jgi:hypothetical protein